MSMFRIGRDEARARLADAAASVPGAIERRTVRLVVSANRAKRKAIWEAYRDRAHADGYGDEEIRDSFERTFWRGWEPGDEVLDAFAGSGTAAVVAAKTGRRFTIIESNAEAIPIIIERLRAVADAREPFDYPVPDLLVHRLVGAPPDPLGPVGKRSK